jgi:hypothetical protein
MHTAFLATADRRVTCKEKLWEGLVAGGGFEPPTFGL